GKCAPLAPQWLFGRAPLASASLIVESARMECAPEARPPRSDLVERAELTRVVHAGPSLAAMGSRTEELDQRHRDERADRDADHEKDGQAECATEPLEKECVPAERSRFLCGPFHARYARQGARLDRIGRAFERDLRLLSSLAFTLLRRFGSPKLERALASLGCCRSVAQLGCTLDFFERLVADCAERLFSARPQLFFFRPDP